MAFHVGHTVVFLSFPPPFPDLWWQLLCTPASETAGQLEAVSWQQRHYKSRKPRGNFCSPSLRPRQVAPSTRIAGSTRESNMGLRKSPGPNREEGREAGCSVLSSYLRAKGEVLGIVYLASKTAKGRGIWSRSSSWEKRTHSDKENSSRDLGVVMVARGQGWPFIAERPGFKFRFCFLSARWLWGTV